MIKGGGGGGKGLTGNTVRLNVLFNIPHVKVLFMIDESTLSLEKGSHHPHNSPNVIHHPTSYPGYFRFYYTQYFCCHVVR